METTVKDFKVSIELNISDSSREKYPSTSHVFGTTINKTLIATNQSKREDFLVELKSSIEEVWAKANTYFKQRDGVFVNEQEKEETF